MDAEDFISGTTSAVEPLIADGGLKESEFITADPVVRRLLLVAGVGQTSTPAATAVATVYRWAGVAGMTVVAALSVLATLIVLSDPDEYDCNASCALVITAKGVASTTMIVAMIVCHLQVRGMLARGTLRLLIGELPRAERERVLRAARGRVLRWVGAACVVVLSYMVALALWAATDGRSPGGVDVDDVLRRQGAVLHGLWTVCTFSGYLLGSVLCLTSLAVALLLLTLTSESLRAMFRHFRGELCRGAIGSPDEALQHYLRLRGNTAVQVRHWQFTVAWLLVAPLLWSAYLTVQVIFDSDNLNWSPLLIYVMYVSIVPITMRALMRVADNVDSLCEAMTAARVFSAAERQLLKSDLRDVPAEFTVYGFKVDRTVLAAAALGLLSSLGQALIEIADDD